MTDLLTPREYLVSKGLAQPGRGRFSGKAKEALVKAIAGGMKFKEPEVKAPSDPRPVVAKVEKVKPQGAADPKAVREWARANNVPIGDRGRIRPEVVNAYLDSCKEGGLKVEAPTSATDDYRPAMAPRFDRVMFTSTDVDGTVRQMNYRHACNVCGYSFVGCLCQSPKVYSLVDVDTLLPVKPTNREVVGDGRFW